mmetsp:Transcript_26202/g.73436  ORF Transcript_26202/g.73436 Transcript_26202/m.73436 type:complete len:102 (-) Transcript_26202:626-931(-)
MEADEPHGAMGGEVVAASCWTTCRILQEPWTSGWLSKKDPTAARRKGVLLRDLCVVQMDVEGADVQAVSINLRDFGDRIQRHFIGKIFIFRVNDRSETPTG